MLNRQRWAERFYHEAEQLYEQGSGYLQMHCGAMDMVTGYHCSENMIGQQGNDHAVMLYLWAAQMMEDPESEIATPD